MNYSVRNINWFTLVELVVTISIVAVLWAIWLFSYNSHLPWVRDANRLSQMESLYSWLKIYSTKNSYAPLPDSNVSVSINWYIYSYQWYAWEDVLSEIDFRKGWIDPKDWTYFTYYTNKSRKYFQILWFLEEEKNLFSFFSKANATSEINYSNRYIKVIWNKLWVLTQNETNIPIQEIESIKTAWNLDLDTTPDIYNANFLDNQFIDWTWSVLQQLDDLLVVWWIWCEFSWDLIKCPTKQIAWWSIINLVDDSWARRWSDGSSSFNCNNYINPSSPYNYGWNTWSGLYWINIWWSNEIKVYCDMSTDWWWWSLVLKADWNQTTFSYDELIWTNNSILNESTNYEFNNSWEYKNTLFSNSKFDNIHIVMETSSSQSGFTINIWDPISMQNMFQNWWEQNTSFWRDIWKWLIPDSSLQSNCNKEWINSYIDWSHSRIRIWIIWNEQDDCLSPDSRLWIWWEWNPNSDNSVWNTASWYPDNGDKNIKSFWYIFIR